RQAVRVFAPQIADRVGEIVLMKESALVELAVAIDRGDLPTVISLKPSREPFTEMLELSAVISLERIAEVSEHERLRQYLESGTAHQHLAELEKAAEELRSFLISNFTVDELLDASGSSRFGDPDSIPGGF